jgi:hypothetical protein
MIDTVVIQPGADTGEPSIAGVSWPAVTAGAIVMCALTLILLAFGTGLGLSVVSPWAGSGVSATTFKIGTGLYLIVIAMLASSIGGYIAGRARDGLACTATKSISVIPRTALSPGRSLRCSAPFFSLRPRAA